MLRTPIQYLGMDAGDMKYRFKAEGVPVDATVEDTWTRVATALAVREKDPALWRKRFADAGCAIGQASPCARIVAAGPRVSAHSF